MTAITAPVANSRLPVCLWLNLAKISSRRFTVYLKRQKTKGTSSTTGTAASIEPPAACHPVKKGQQRQGRIQVPASHEQCLPVARRLFPHVKRLADKPYIVYPFQHSRTGYREPAVKIQIFRLLRQDCEAFFIILQANGEQKKKIHIPTGA